MDDIAVDCEGLVLIACLISKDDREADLRSKIFVVGE